jgi:hypothetical protein
VSSANDPDSRCTHGTGYSIEHNKLEFTLSLKVRRDKHLLPQIAVRMPPPPLPIIAPITAPPPQKEKTGGFRAFLSGSPKKSKPAKASTPPPQPAPSPPAPTAPTPTTAPEEPLVKYLKPDGTLGRIFLCFKDVASHCDTQLYETSLDVVSGVDDRSGKGPRKIGEMVIQMFRLPPLPGIPPDQLPQSLEECMRGMRHIHWHKITYHEGILTQNGGDCKVNDHAHVVRRSLTSILVLEAAAIPCNWCETCGVQ